MSDLIDIICQLLEFSKNEKELNDALHLNTDSIKIVELHLIEKL